MSSKASKSSFAIGTTFFFGFWNPWEFFVGMRKKIFSVRLAEITENIIKIGDIRYLDNIRNKQVKFELSEKNCKNAKLFDEI